MSVAYQWTIAFLKQWIQPISYVIGFDYNYNIIFPYSQNFQVNFLGGSITAAAMFTYPVIAVYGFSYVNGYLSEPLAVFLDYPSYSLFISISISP